MYQLISFGKLYLINFKKWDVSFSLTTWKRSVWFTWEKWNYIQGKNSVTDLKIKLIYSSFVTALLKEYIIIILNTAIKKVKVWSKWELKRKTTLTQFWYLCILGILIDPLCKAGININWKSFHDVHNCLY